MKDFKIAVLDLDWTLWRGDCGKDIAQPFYYAGSNPISNGEIVYDGWGRVISIYPDIRQILQGFRNAGILIAFASRNPDAASCKALLQAFGLYDMATVFLAHSSHGDNKNEHFATIQERTGIAYRDMIFFDDRPANISSAQDLGVTAILCKYPGGLTMKHVAAALQIPGGLVPI